MSVGNDTFSLVPGGGDVVVDGSSTVPLAQTTVDVGGVVYTAFLGGSEGGPGPTASATVLGNGTVMVFEGVGSRNGVEFGLGWMVMVVGLLGGLMVWL